MNTLISMKNWIKKLHNDEQGAEGLEKILIIAAIVLPLLGLLLYFKDYITGFVAEETDQMRQDADNYDPDVF